MRGSFVLGGCLAVLGVVAGFVDVVVDCRK